MPVERAVVAEPGSAVNRHGDPLFMTFLARGLLVIRAFSGPKRRRTIADISRATGLSRAAVRCCLYTLCELGYAKCRDRTYRFRPKVLAVSHGALLATSPLRLSGRRSAQIGDACARHQRDGR